MGLFASSMNGVRAGFSSAWSYPVKEQKAFTHSSAKSAIALSNILPTMFRLGVMQHAGFWAFVGPHHALGGEMRPRI